MGNRRLSVALAAALCTSACGGGGGGGGGGAGPNTPSLSIDKISPSSFDAELNAGEVVPDFTVVAHVSGDVSLLDGKTLYLVIEDPSQLFAGAPILIADQAAQTAEIRLSGTVKGAPATLQGQLRFFACLDPQCKTQLGNSPYPISYRVVVHPGLVVGSAQPLSALFGLTPAAVDVPVTLPYGTTSPSVRALVSDDHVTGSTLGGTVTNFQGNVFETTLEPSAGLQTALHVAAPPMFVGTYSTIFEISAGVERGGRFYPYSAQVRVDYTVAPNAGVPVAVVPLSATFDFRVGDANPRHLGISVMAQSGILNLGTVDYSNSVPGPGADPEAPYKSWLSTFDFISVSPCLGTGIGLPHCMAAGSYLAKIPFTHVDTGVNQDYAIPITLNVMQ